MRRQLAICLMVLVAVAVAAAVMILKSTHPAVHGPSLSLEPAVVDFGVMEPGQASTQTVNIRNVGDEQLTIDKLLPDCGCTTAELAKSSLSPGDHTTLSIAFDSKGFHRAVHKHVSVVSNDPRGLIAVTVQAYVKEGLRLSADRVKLGRARAGQTLSGDTYVLRDKGEGTPDIVFRGVPDDLKVSTGQWEDMGVFMQRRIAMTVSPVNRPAGFYRQPFEVLVGDSLLPLTVEYELLPLLEYEPTQVRMTRPQGTFEDQVLVIRWPSSTAKPVISVSSTYGKCRPTIDGHGPSDCRIRLAAREETIKPSGDLDIVRVSYTIGAGQEPETLAVPVIFVGPE